jgi:hypothetical protein
VVDKVKSLLPFQTLPLFDLAANDNADLGPNEVSKSAIKDIGENVKDGIDTAAPGKYGCSAAARLAAFGTAPETALHLLAHCRASPTTSIQRAWKLHEMGHAALSHQVLEGCDTNLLLVLRPPGASCRAIWNDWQEGGPV